MSESSSAAYLNALSADAARSALVSCCASRRWVEEMLSTLPFSGDRTLLAAAEAIWWRLDEADWLEAFAGHPRIGERAGPDGAASTSRSAAWSEREQSGTAEATPETLRELAAGNRKYEERFGHVFLICATGRSADAMLAELRNRLSNDHETELRIAAGEQAKITRLRLEKLSER